MPAQHEEKTPGIDMELLKRFVELRDERDKLKEEIAEVEKALTPLDVQLAEQFALAGVQSVNMAGRTVYRNVDKYITVKADQREQAVAIANALGLDELIVLQPARLKSYISEQLEETGEMPGDFASVLNVFEKASMRVRKA